MGHEPARLTVHLAEGGLGHLIQQVPGSAHRGAVRGAGFEAGTQGWATLRAGQGMLVTTSLRAGTYGSAESTQMDAAEAVAQLHAAQDLAERLGQAARHARALDLAPHAEATRELLRHLDPAEDGAYAGPVHGQDAHKLDAQRQPGDPVERPAAPTITFDTPCTLAQLSEASIVHYAAEDQAWVAQGDWHEAAAHTASLVAGGTASWYTHEGGIQLKAAHGPVSVRAHTDRLEILADQDVQILSVNDEIVVQAQQRIELVGGDSAVVLDGAHIDFITPGSFTVEAATHEWDGGSSAPAMLNPLPQGLQSLPPHELHVQHAYHDDEGLQAARFEARLGDGSVRRGITDAAGTLSLPDVPPGPVQVRFEPDGRVFERRDDTCHDRRANLQALTRMRDRLGWLASDGMRRACTEWIDNFQALKAQGARMIPRAIRELDAWMRQVQRAVYQGQWHTVTPGVRHITREAEAALIENAPRKLPRQRSGHPANAFEDYQHAEGWPDLRRGAKYDAKKRTYFSETITAFSGPMRAVELKPGQTIYRVLLPARNSKASPWWLEKLPETAQEWRELLAVLDKFNKNNFFIKYTIPEGTTLKAWRGKAAEQFHGEVGQYLPGGGLQLFVDFPPHIRAEVLELPALSTGWGKTTKRYGYAPQADAAIGEIELERLAANEVRTKKTGTGP